MGPTLRDDEAFGPSAVPALRGAVADLSWLLERGYATVSAVKLVGDRWSLTDPPARRAPGRLLRHCPCGQAGAASGRG